MEAGSEILALMKRMKATKDLSDIESGLFELSSFVSAYYDLDKMSASDFLEELYYAFQSMKAKFSDDEAGALGKFVNVLIAAGQ